MGLVEDIGLPTLAGAAAGGMGLVTHQIFKRKEPTVYEAVAHVLVVNTLMSMAYNVMSNGADGPFQFAKAIGLNFVIYISSLSISMILYRTMFHPLNEFSGPWLCKVTRFVATYHILKRDTHVWLTELHNQYGDAVRVSPNEIAFASATSVEHIHGSKAGKLAKGQFYGGDPNRAANSMLSTPDIDEHRWRRKIWERGFGTIQLKAYEKRVLKHLDVLVSQLQKRAGQPVDMTHWAEFFAYDVMSDLGFSEDFGMLEQGEPHRYVSALHGNARVLFAAAQTPWIKPLMWLFPIDSQSKADAKDFRLITRETYDRRRARSEVKPDMFQTIAANPKGLGPRPLTENEIIADASLIIMAGSTSTAVTVTNIFAYLCRNQSQIKRLQQEVDKCWAGDNVLDVAALGPAAAPYLNAVIEEALRIWPPAPGPAQRTTPSEGLVVDSKFIPAGTQVSVTPISLHRHPNHYTKPQEFIPERWLDAERPANWKHDVRAFIPFTVGQFACLGKNLAYQEMRLFLGMVAKNFDFQWAPGFSAQDYDSRIRYKGTLLLGPCMMVLTPRK